MMYVHIYVMYKNYVSIIKVRKGMLPNIITHMSCTALWATPSPLGLVTPVHICDTYM